jgi:hypothetical protein
LDGVFDFDWQILELAHLAQREFTVTQRAEHNATALCT